MYPKNDISWDLDKYVGAFNFRLTVNGVPQESMKVLGVSNVISESEIVEYKLGHEPYVRKIPGRSKFSEVEVTRIYQGYDQMYSWRTKIEDGIEDLRNVKIEILAPDLSTVILQMVLHNCWPHRWQLPNLDASSTAPATETIALACERVTQSMATPKSVTSSITMLDATPPQIPEAIDFLPPTGGAEEQDFRDNDLTKYSGDEEQDFRDNDLTKFQGEGEQDFRENTTGINVAEDATAERSARDGTGPIINEKVDYGGSAAAEDPTAESFGGDGSGPVIVGNASGETMEFADTSDGSGPIGGQGEAEEADYGAGAGPIDQAEFSGDINTVDDPTAAKNGGDGDGPIDQAEFSGDINTVDDPTAGKNGGDGSGPIGGQGAPETADYGSGSGPIGGQGAPETADSGSGSGPIDPSQKGFGASEAADDPTAARNGGDGSGPIGGQGAPETADSGSGSGPIDPSQKGFGASAGADDPTAGANGGDGSGPLGQGEAATADGGAGSGPIDNERQDFGGSAAADDPTAAKNGGDGSGPIGGQGAAPEADYGSPGSGPIGGQGAPEGAG